MNLLKLFKTKVLKQVIYDDSGYPVDVRGLKCRGKPFTDSAEYYIQDDLDKRWHYLGNGVYWSIKRGCPYRHRQSLLEGQFLTAM